MMGKWLGIIVAACVMLSSYIVMQGKEKPAVFPIQEIAGNTLPSETVVPIGKTDTPELPASVLESYYVSSQEPVFDYLQNNSIQRFWNMWVSYFIEEDLQVHWDYDTLAPVQLLDHDFQSVAKDGEKALYTCTFTTEDGRCGYIIVAYNQADPSISKWSLQETTPYLYDLRANSQEITAALLQTDIDLSTAVASRVEWIDTEKKRGDRVILFTDGKQDRYVCFLGEEPITIEKQ